MKRPVALSLVLVAACTSEPASGPPSKAATPVATGPLAASLVVSNPVLGRVNVGAAPLQTVVYVSLPPRTISDVATVVVLNERTHGAATPALTDGGFDPVAIPGAIGDTVDVSVYQTGSNTSHTRIAVVAARLPRVIRTNPPQGATDVPLWSVVDVVFSEPIDAASLTGSSLQLLRGSSAVPGQVTFGDPAHLVVRFTPETSLAGAVGYQVAVTAAVRDLDGQSPETAVSASFTTGVEIVHDPSADQIAFVGIRAGVRRISVMYADGSGVSALTNAPREQGQPTWSPDGSKIAFSGIENGVQEIYVVNADGSHLAKLTNDGNGSSLPAWSPDGSRIAFARFGASAGICVMHADGSGVTLVRASPRGSSDLGPTWSPDGSQLAFVDNPDDGIMPSTVYVMNADGSAARPISIGPASYAEGVPTWSRDGHSLLFASDWSKPGFALISSDGFSSVTRIPVAEELAVLNRPDWSPDGKRIVFWSELVGPDIFVMNADGSGTRRLTTGGSGEWPAWRPKR